MLAWDYIFWAALAIALGGLGLALSRALPVDIPAWVRKGHGLAALFVIGALFVVNLVNEDATPVIAWWALGVLASGLVGGLLFFRVLNRGMPPVWLVMGHGSVGATGVYLLYLASGLSA